MKKFIKFFCFTFAWLFSCNSLGFAASWFGRSRTAFLALLLLQAADCNYQTPAKAYEYIRAGKPVLVLSPEPSDTWQLMVQTGKSVRAELDDSAQIAAALQDVITSTIYTENSNTDTTGFSREHGAEILHKLASELLQAR